MLGRIAMCVLALPLWAGGCTQPSGRQLRVGDPLPRLELVDTAGLPLSRHLQAGTTTVINFWASWCEPCRREMPGLQRMHTELAAEGIRVIGINVDSDENLALEFLRQNRISFPNCLDPGQRIARDVLEIDSYPLTLVVNREGRIVRSLPGSRNWDDPELRNLLLADRHRGIGGTGDSAVSRR